MDSMPVLTLTLLCLVTASQARNIFQPEAENASESECSCDRRFLRHYDARGCVAELLDICGCPTKFSCPPTYANTDLQVCIYRGQEYAVGSRIRTPDSCQVCRCQDGSPPRMSCVTRECPELTPVDGENCHPVYAENKCCPLTFECLGNEIEDGLQASSSKTCIHGGRVYPLGAKIQAADDPCLVCLCDEGWNDGNRTCAETDCVMERHQHKMDEGCVPVYHEGRCCPIEFYCPSVNASLSELPVSEETNTTYDDRCFFAGHSYDRGEEIPVEDNNPCVVCRCTIPPHPTCVHQTCPPAPAPNCARTYTPGQCCPEYECMMGDGPAEEEECPTPMCQHTNCHVGVPPGEKCPTCICGEMVSELEHNNLEQHVQRNLQQQQVVPSVNEEMEPLAQFVGGVDDYSEGGLQLMPLVMEEKRSVQQLPNASYEDEESDKEVNEDDDMDMGQGLPELDREEKQGKKNGTLIINEIWSIDHDIEVPEGCPTPMCEGNWCKILIPEGHNCPTCICKRFDKDNEP